MDQRVTLRVEGMGCEGCVASVKKALEGVNGVSWADVDLEAGKATVTLQRELPVEALVEAVEAAGYDARPA